MNYAKNKQFSDYEQQSERQNQSSYQYSQCLQKEKKLKIKLKKQRIYKLKNHGSWKKQQEEKFIQFMRQKIQIFRTKQQRRSKKIFLFMSKFIKTRSSEQCRSHHQKYQNRFKYPQQIIQHVQGKIRENAFIQNQSNSDQIIYNNRQANKEKFDLVFHQLIKNKSKSLKNKDQSFKNNLKAQQQQRTTYQPELLLQEEKNLYTFQLLKSKEAKKQIGFLLQLNIQQLLLW